MIAVDTNVLVYRFDRSNPAKQLRAKKLLHELALGQQTLMLWQVAGELLSQFSHWKHQKLMRQEDMVRVLNQLRRLFPIMLPSEHCLDLAVDLYSRYSLQLWDSMLLGACLAADVDTLYTEDMGAPRQIDSITLINPFRY